MGSSLCAEDECDVLIPDDIEGVLRRSGRVLPVVEDNVSLVSVSVTRSTWRRRATWSRDLRRICDEIDLAVADNIKPRPPLSV